MLSTSSVPVHPSRCSPSHCDCNIHTGTYRSDFIYQHVLQPLFPRRSRCVLSRSTSLLCVDHVTSLTVRLCDDTGARCTRWNQARLLAPSSRVILTSIPESARSKAVGRFSVAPPREGGLARPSSAFASSNSRTYLPLKYRSSRLFLLFGRRAVLQRSSNLKGVFCDRPPPRLGDGHCLLCHC